MTHTHISSSSYITIIIKICEKTHCNCIKLTLTLTGNASELDFNCVQCFKESDQ